MWCKLRIMLLSRLKNKMPKNLGRKLGNVTMAQVFAVVLFGFISIQILAKIFGKWFHILDIRIGWIFQMIIISFVIYLMFVFIVKKQATLEKKDLLILIIMIGILMALFFYLPKFLPEIFTFTTGNEQIQSFLGG